MVMGSKIEKMCKKFETICLKDGDGKHLEKHCNKFEDGEGEKVKCDQV